MASPKPLSSAIARLAAGLDKAGLRTFARLTFDLVGDRSVQDHRAWDKQEHEGLFESAVEALGEGIHSPPGVEVELPPDMLQIIDALPGVSAGQKEKVDSLEFELLEQLDVATRDGNERRIKVPGRILGAIRSLFQDNDAWNEFESQQGRPGLVGEVVEPLRGRIVQATSPDVLFRLSCQAARIYRVSVATVSVDELLRAAPEFVVNAGSGGAVTFSRSSGVVDPLERHGTSKLLDRLEIDPRSKVAQEIELKSPWREINFREGLLNPSHSTRVFHFFDQSATAQALRNTWQRLPEELGDRYLELAAECLLDAWQVKHFELYSISEFPAWMQRYSRSARGHALIVFRHPETKAIAEGLELNFPHAETMHRWFQRIFRVSQLVSAPLLPIPALIAATAEVEDSLFSILQAKVLSRSLLEDAERQAVRVQFGSEGSGQKREAARELIDQMIAFAGDQGNG